MWSRGENGISGRACLRSGILQRLHWLVHDGIIVKYVGRPRFVSLEIDKMVGRGGQRGTRQEAYCVGANPGIS